MRTGSSLEDLYHTTRKKLSVTLAKSQVTTDGTRNASLTINKCLQATLITKFNTCKFIKFCVFMGRKVVEKHQ
jgi:hypothetical protein